MVFAEFYRKSFDGIYTPACGDRSVIILDGRMRKDYWSSIAAKECKARGFDGYRIARGRFSAPVYVTKLEKV